MAGTKRTVVKEGWVDIPVDRILPAPWNYKGEDAKLSKALLSNLQKNGQIESCIVRVHPKRKGYFEMVNGNHRLELFAEAGVTTAHCFNLGKVSEAAAKRIAVETNETRFGADHIKLAATLKEMVDAFERDDLLATLPYTGTEVDNYVDLLQFDWSSREKPPPPPGSSLTTLNFKLSEEQWNEWVTVMQKSGTNQPLEALMMLVRLANETDGWPDTQAH